MNAIQQRCRPKHQVLVLKCYPRTTKGAVDVKPNSSELSYLLFYATSRRSKIQKVGGFLEKKTASDVWRQRIGNVQVTLQILTALIEKAPKDLPLFAPYVLKILELVLRSGDLTMVESSLPTFATFCENHDASTLLADQVYLQQYQSVVRTYAALASTRQSPGKTTPTKPVALRWRNAGLDAIRSIASSDSLASVSALQLDVIVPMILENLWTDDDMLEVLQQRSQTEKPEADKLKRRTSIATVRTVETATDPNPIALSGSALDVDRLAEEDIGVLAMQCLKQVFVVPNRSQIHGATAALLKFIEERLEQHEVVVERNERTGTDSGWAIKIFGLVSRWSPVQDRFMILVTAMETLMLTPLNEDTLQQHLALTAMIGSLLRSDVNMIGLSVMDVLLGLIQQMKKLIHLPGSRLDTTDHSGDENDRSPSAVEAAETLSAQRKELLGRLQRCMGDLATHVYYADQISDMILSILLRLKPSPTHSTANSSPPGENADGPSNGMSSATNLQDSQNLETYFSVKVAKIAALQAIKSILLVANSTTKMSGNVSLSRNRVPMFVWEGTQWLLRDPDGLVRKAYADALVTWMERETTIADLKAHDDHAVAHRNFSRNGHDANAMARRAASTASAREKPGKLPRSHFMQLLHVAIYENALQHVDFETDILLLHVLLTKLTMRFGVNAVRHGLPMIFRLQEDIQDVETPLAKVRIGGLCHGYFWGLTEMFNFDESVVGRAIHNEIVRRRSKNFWVEGINIPPPLVELVGTPGMQRPQPKMPLREIQSESLLPFDDRISLVECIATGYQESTVSPPTSPAGSPGRSYAFPMNSNLSTVPTIEADQELPSKMREEMLTFEWSRESVISMIQESSKSASLNGSRSGTTGTNRHLLAINGCNTNGHSPAIPSSPVHSAHNLRPGSRQDHTSPMALHRLRKSSVKSAASHSPASVSSRGFVTSVDQLKLVLAGGPVASPATSGQPMRDDSSESLASYEFTPSELSFNPAPAEQAEAISAPMGGLTRSTTGSSRKGSANDSLDPLSLSIPHELRPITHQGEEEEDEKEKEKEQVPPVPPLPSSLTPKKHPPAESRPATGISVRDHAHKSTRRSLKSRGGESAQFKSVFTEVPVPTMDLQALLKGIDSHAGEGSIGNVTRPPY